jgi:hypothetical protein
MPFPGSILGTHQQSYAMHPAYNNDSLQRHHPPAAPTAGGGGGGGGGGYNLHISSADISNYHTPSNTSNTSNTSIVNDLVLNRRSFPFERQTEMQKQSKRSRLE